MADSILIVGAGPTGLLMAAELTRQGVPCRIIDKLTAPSQLSKAVAIQSRTLELFDRLGIIKDFLDVGQKVHAANLYADRQPIAHINLAELDSPYPYILDVSQDVTEGILTRHLAALGVTVERGVELATLDQDAQGVTATLRHADGTVETVQTPWLIGCDGAHSAARHLLGMDFTGAAYPEIWALADVQVEWSLPDDAMHLFLAAAGIFAAFPLGQGRFRLIAELPEGKHATPDDAPTLAAFQASATAHVPQAVTLRDPRWLAYFHINRRQAQSYRQGRVFLAGDAMHIHSPAGGQGMNTGLQDAANLAWKLALVERGQAPDDLLATYEQERHPVAASVLQMSDLMLKAATLRNPVAQQIRNHLAPLLAGQEVIQQRLARQIAELNINYRHSSLSAEDHAGFLPAHGPRAGDRAPDAAPLLRANGAAIRLFDLLRAPQFTLLLFAHDGECEHLTEIAAMVRERYGDLVESYLITSGDAAPTGITMTVLRDPKLAAQRAYGAGESLYFIRPDGYIGYRSQPAQGEQLLAYLGKILNQRA